MAMKVSDPNLYRWYQGQPKEILPQMREESAMPLPMAYIVNKRIEEYTQNMKKISAKALSEYLRDHSLYWTTFFWTSDALLTTDTGRMKVVKNSSEVLNFAKGSKLENGALLSKSNFNKVDGYELYKDEKNFLYEGKSCGVLEYLVGDKKQLNQFYQCFTNIKEKQGKGKAPIQFKTPATPNHQSMTLFVINDLKNNQSIRANAKFNSYSAQMLSMVVGKPANRQTSFADLKDKPDLDDSTYDHLIDLVNQLYQMRVDNHRHQIVEKMPSTSAKRFLNTAYDIAHRADKHALLDLLSGLKKE